MLHPPCCRDSWPQACQLLTKPALVSFHLPLPRAGPAPGPTRLSVPIEWERLQAIREQVAANAIANGSGSGGGTSAPSSPDLAAVTARRSLSSGDPGGSAPFGGSIPEGGPFTPTMVPASSLPSPFANSLQAVSAGGMLSLGAMQQQQQAAAAVAAAAAGLYPGVYPQALRQSDNSSLTGSTADATSSMHSTASDGQHAAAMAGGCAVVVCPLSRAAGCFGCSYGSGCTVPWLSLQGAVFLPGQAVVVAGSMLPTQGALPCLAGVMLEGFEEWEIQPDEIVLGPRIGIGRCAAGCLSDGHAGFVDADDHLWCLPRRTCRRACNL